MASYLITSWQIEGEKVETEEMMLSNCGAGGDTWESLGRQEDQPVNPRKNQPWIFIGRTVAEAEAPILWPPDARANSLEKTLLLGKIEGKRRKGWQRIRWLDSVTDSVDMNLSKLGDIVKDMSCCMSWHAAVHGVAKHGIWFRDWTTTKKHLTLLFVPLNKILLGPEVHIFICLISFRLSVEKEFFSDLSNLISVYL